MSYRDEEITRLYKVRKTIMEMLKDRGYVVTDDEINMTKQQFIEKYGEDVRRQDLFMHKAKQDNSSDQVGMVVLLSS